MNKQTQRFVSLLSCVAVLSAVAGLATSASAQPQTPYFGTLGGPGNNAVGLGAYSTGSVMWFRIDLGSPTSATRYYDFYTIAGPHTDVEIALFDASGQLLAQNDDWDNTSLQSALSFGQSSLRRRKDLGYSMPLTGVPMVGQQGDLAAGSYYVCVANYNAAFSPNFGVVTSDTADRALGLQVDTNVSFQSSPAFYPQNNPISVVSGGAFEVVGYVTPGQLPTSTGLTVTIDISSIGGPAAMILRDDGTGADQAAGDDFWSASAVLPASTPSGLITLPVRVADAQGRATTNSVRLNVSYNGPTVSNVTQAGTIRPADTVVLQAAVVAGTLPPSAGLRVTADLSGFGGDAAMVMYDDGTRGDAVAGDSIFSVAYTIPQETVPGTYNLPLTVSDDLGRTSNTSGTNALLVSRRSNLGQLSFVNPYITARENLAAGQVLWYEFAAPQGANASHFIDINTLGNTILQGDTLIGLYREDGTLIASNDDWDINAPFPSSVASLLTFGQQSSPRVYAPWTRPADGGSGTSLPATHDLYYLAVTGYPAIFASGFTVITSHTRTGVSQVNLYTGASCSTADVVGGGGVPPADGIVDGSDFIAFINSFGVGDPTVDGVADVNGDAVIDGGDFVAFINAFAEGC